MIVIDEDFDRLSEYFNKKVRSFEVLPFTYLCIMASLNLVKLNIAIPIKSKLWQYILHESFLLISTYLPKIHL